MGRRRRKRTWQRLGDSIGYGKMVSGPPYLQHRSMLTVEIVKGINNMRLQNTVMQLRKACSHPLLFTDPTEPLPETTEELVDASGKMMLLERLLDELFRTKHKVLLFSQFTTMLDIIEVCVSPSPWGVTHSRT